MTFRHFSSCLVQKDGRMGSTRKAVFSNWVRRKWTERFISNNFQPLFFLPLPISKRWIWAIVKFFLSYFSYFLLITTFISHSYVLVHPFSKTIPSFTSSTLTESLLSVIFLSCLLIVLNSSSLFGSFLASLPATLTPMALVGLVGWILILDFYQDFGRFLLCLFVLYCFFLVFFVSTSITRHKSNFTPVLLHNFNKLETRREKILSVHQTWFKTT